MTASAFIGGSLGPAPHVLKGHLACANDRDDGAVLWRAASRFFCVCLCGERDYSSLQCRKINLNARVELKASSIVCLMWMFAKSQQKDRVMNGIIYLVGLVVVVLFILSLLGLR